MKDKTSKNEIEITFTIKRRYILKRGETLEEIKEQVTNHTDDWLYDWSTDEEIRVEVNKVAKNKYCHSLFPD